MGTTGRGGGGGGAARGGGGLRTLGGGGLPTGTRIPGNAETFATQDAAARRGRAVLEGLRLAAETPAQQAIVRATRVRPVRLSRDDGTVTYTPAIRLTEMPGAGSAARRAGAVRDFLAFGSGTGVRRVTTGRGFQTFFLTR